MDNRAAPARRAPAQAEEALMSTTDPSPTEAKLGQKNLSTIHAVAQSLAIGPMFSTALLLGLVSNPATGAGWNATLAILLAGLGVLAIGYAVTLYARRFAGAGAVYEYLTHGARPWVGVLTAGVFFLGTLFLGGGGIYLGVGLLSEGAWQAHISDNAPAWWVFGLIGLAIVLILNYLGVRVAVRTMLTFAALSFVPMLILAVVILAKGGADGISLSVFDPGETSLFQVTGGGVLGGVLIGILLFVGFEAAASIGEESNDPHRSIPRAVLFTIAASGLFYVVMAFAFSMGYGKQAVSEGAWALSPGAVNEMATRYIGSWYAAILDVVVILDAMALALAICVTIGRGYFALARDGLLPKVFAKTSRYDTPWVGNLMVAVGGIGLMLVSWLANYQGRFVAPGADGALAPIFPSDGFATFILSATIGSFAVELVYLILAVVAFGLVRRAGNKLWQYAVLLVAVATPILGFYGALNPAPHDRTNVNWEAIYWTIGVVVVAIAWFVVVLLLRPANVRAAASHAAEHRGVAALDERLDYEPLPENEMPL
jgi:amino acid transporter